ncbi:DNA polymerase I [Bacillus phage vB_BceH_LY2]|nr:DNA polymerase I [Bacillus phage vB_BceH_LY2]
MSKHNLGNPELEALATFKGASAVIMGYLVRERGVIAPAPFNKLFTELGYERMNKDEISEVATDINGDGTLVYLYDLARDGKLHLQDIPNAQGEEEKLKEDDVFSIVTPYIEQKEDQASKLREFRKLQRDGTAMKLLFDKLKQSLLEELKDLPRAKHITSDLKPLQRGDKALILALSDWHTGLMTFGSRTGDYNFDRLVRTVNSIVEWTLEEIEDKNIKELHVVFLGDLIENTIMRHSQAYDSEFHLAEQISQGTRLIVDVLSELSKHIHVTFSITSGNHSRFMQDKNSNISNSYVEFTVLDLLFTLQESLGQLPNVTLTDNREDIERFVIDVAGKRVVGVHGDKMPKGKEKISTYMKDGKEVSLLLSGHMHSTEIVQESYDRLWVQVGSPVGENDYSRSLNCPITSPAQMAIILQKGKKTKELIPLILDENGEVC